MGQGVATVDQCENICLSSSACVAYTYNIKHTTCIPKTVIGDLTQAQSPAITGVVERQGRGVVSQGLSVQEAKASFDCLKASSAQERAICASQTLSRLDDELATLYQAWIASHSGAAARASQRHQKDFLAARKKCGANPSDFAVMFNNRSQAQLGRDKAQARQAMQFSPSAVQQLPLYKSLIPQPKRRCAHGMRQVWRALAQV